MMGPVASASLLWFPPEWLKAALVLALTSVWVVIALFTYLNRHTQKRYFRFWTAAWMFYSVYLAVAIGLEETPAAPLLVMVRLACIGLTALLIFWGVCDLRGQGRSLRELGLGAMMVILWSVVAAYSIRNHYWIAVPVFLLLAATGMDAGLRCLGDRSANTGRRILGLGLFLWGLHLSCYPFLEGSAVLQAAGYLTSAVLSSLITIGMVVEQQVALSTQNYQALFAAASDAMLLVNFHTQQVVEANASAQRIRPDLVGLALTEVFPELDDTVHRAGGPMRCREVRRLRVDGGEQVYEVRANLLLAPEGPLLLLVVRDITERKEAEQTLRRTNERLTETLAELRRTQAQVVQQERLRALGRMASGVAHDFNNALAKILGFNELLLMSPEHLRDTDKVKQYLQMIGASAQDAVKIVNRLREFYRSRQETDSTEPVHLVQVLEQAVILTQPKWKDQMLAAGTPVELDLDLQEIPLVRGDAEDLREALINLIFNAVDAMPAGGRLGFRTRQEGDGVVVEVRDTGTGMSEEVRRHCLEPFFTTKAEEGTGLGLAIVYGIIQRHGGKIQIQSAPGQGTVVSIQLPLATAGGAVTPVLTAGANLKSPLHILLVEDEPLLLDIEREYLTSDGHTVETAVDGREGWEKFRAGCFDLVLVDQAMPQMNGEQLACFIKQAAPHTPIILVTGFNELQSPQGQPAHIDWVVAKPFTAGALRQAVAKAVA